MQKLVSVGQDTQKTPWKDEPQLALTADRYQVVDMGVNRTGMIGASVACDTKTVLLFAFDEILTDTPQAKDDVNFRRLGCVNVVRYELEPGSYELESIEPYTFRYLKAICLTGECKIKDLYLREYAHPRTPQAHFAASDKRLNQLYAAGVETFRQNTLDIFMDCPSRERAGWLCDSLFTARVAPDLTGTTVVEKAFMETSSCRIDSSTSPTACCPCAIRPITTTGTSFPTGRSSLSSSWKNILPEAEIR